MPTTVRGLRGPSPHRRRLAKAVLAGLVMASLVAGCGASEPVDGPVDGPATTDDGTRLADPRFEGDFLITGIEVGGAARTPIQQPRLTIDSRFGGLSVQPGCNIYFGSFTLDEDGTASFTVTGGSDLDCGDLADQEATVLAALAGATAWTAVDGGFRFDGPDVALTVAGPEA